MKNWQATNHIPTKSQEHIIPSLVIMFLKEHSSLASCLPAASEAGAPAPPSATRRSSSTAAPKPPAASASSRAPEASSSSSRVAVPRGELGKPPRPTWNLTWKFGDGWFYTWFKTWMNFEGFKDGIVMESYLGIDSYLWIWHISAKSVLMMVRRTHYY